MKRKYGAFDATHAGPKESPKTSCEPNNEDMLVTARHTVGRTVSLPKEAKREPWCNMAKERAMSPNAPFMSFDTATNWVCDALVFAPFLSTQ